MFYRINVSASQPAIIWRHLLPNVLGVILVAYTLGMGNGIIIESTLSFLGVNTVNK